MQKPPQGKRQKRGEIAFALHLYLTHNSCCRFDLSESTIRMWLRKSDGLDYRGPSYNRLHSERVPFQGTLQVPLSLYSDWSHFFRGVPGRCTWGNQDWSWSEQVSRMSHSTLCCDKVVIRNFQWLNDTRHDVDKKQHRLTEMTGPLKPRHAEFLQQLMAEYGGARLTKVDAVVKLICVYWDVSSRYLTKWKVFQRSSWTHWSRG